MPNDVVIEFYIASVKVQLYEYRFFNTNISGDRYAELVHEMEIVRRELGAAMCQLLTSALPSLMRDPRDFRTKYIEEVDLRNLERCLVAAANRVLAYTSSSSPRDFDLRSAQPAASEFLDTLSQVQCLVSNVIELALAAADRVSLSTPDCNTSSHNTLPSTDSPANTEHHQEFPSHSRGSALFATLTTTPSLLRTRRTRSCRPGTSSTDVSHIDAPLSTLASQSTEEYSNGQCTMTTVEVKVGSDVYRQPLRLPPPWSLCISDELCSKLGDLDKAAANFELEFVRCLSRRLRTRQEAMDLQFVTVLFSETLMWGLAVQLFNMQQLADRDPSVLLSLPRLAVLVGTRILPDSPIGANRLAAGHRLPFMFASSRSDLAYLARQLHALRSDQLCRLARWLGPRGLPNLVSAEQRKQRFSPIGNAANRTLFCGRKNAASSNSPLLATRSTSGSRTPTPSMFSSTGSVNSNPQTARTWRTNLSGLHQLYKKLSAVADEFTTKFPTELRYILQTCIELHDTSNSDAAIAQMEGKDVRENHCSDCSDSSDTELDDEVTVSEQSTDKHLSSLAQLFDWSNVVNKSSSKKNMSDMLKLYCSHFDPKSESDSLPVPVKSCHTRLTSTVDDLNLEFGLDVAAMLSPTARSSTLGEDDTCLCDYLNQASDSDHMTQRLGKLTLGVAVEGKQNLSDQLLHYLPAWQPDRLPDRIGDSKSPSYDTESDQDLETDEESDVEQTVMFVVGRQCATCLQPFTLFRRRHHCRRCGHIFCANCCGHWQTVEGLATSKPVRVCSECFHFLNSVS